ncbi:uncharacterized protein TNCV_5094481 [Trichonephila clavipes]|nr:uncharacterized protein TNCV_5094481 [Trichonephila clavipes]
MELRFFWRCDLAQRTTDLEADRVAFPHVFDCLFQPEVVLGDDHSTSVCHNNIPVFTTMPCFLRLVITICRVSQNDRISSTQLYSSLGVHKNCPKKRSCTIHSLREKYERQSMMSLPVQEKTLY